MCNITKQNDFLGDGITPLECAQGIDDDDLSRPTGLCSGETLISAAV